MITPQSCHQVRERRWIWSVLYSTGNGRETVRRRWREVQENLKTLSDSMSLEEGNKKKRKKSRKADGDSRDNSFEVGSDTKRDDNENLIMVGGIAGYDEETKPRVKSYKEFREQLDLFLEKKNRNKKRSRNPGTVDEDPRSKKIKKLKNDDTHWRGLE